MAVRLPTAERPVEIVCGDCREVLPALPADQFDAVVTDPPYELGFMGQAWDRTGVAFDPVAWAAVLRVLKPGGYLLAMGGSRTYHRLACAVEDAGFEVRDCLLWLYGTGFPKGKGCLKPAYEPILLCRRPGPRVLPLGVDECRVPVEEGDEVPVFVKRGEASVSAYGDGINGSNRTGATSHAGRYPANVLHDGSDEVLAAFAAFGESKSTPHQRGDGIGKGYGGSDRPYATVRGVADAGTAARFFYCAKASKAERGAGNTHRTIKPLALIRYIVRLVCPVGGLVLDPFAGSGTTLLAAMAEGRQCLGVEMEPAHCEIIGRRVAATLSDGPGHLTAGLAPDLFAGAT